MTRLTKWSRQMQEVVKDRDLIWDMELYDVVLVGTSPYCNLNNGFQSKVKYKYPIVEEVNDKLPYGDLRRIGTRKTIEETTPVISLCFICQSPNISREHVDYEGLENCLATANAEFRGKRVATPILGASRFDGVGDREKCLEIIKSTMTDVDLFIYDYPQLSRADEIRAQRKAFVEKYYLKVDSRTYKKLKAKLPGIYHKLYLGPDPAKPITNAQEQYETRNIPKIYVNRTASKR